MAQQTKQPGRRKPPKAEEEALRLEMVIDQAAAPGNPIPALVRLLLAITDREQKEGARQSLG
ncbi:MAG TPA: hypothetical protein VK395_19995 [Gemmataceae bacterium]|nr:hypothetical protein [Gemmataceae bacterium]